MFSSKSLVILAIAIMSIIHLGLIFVYSVRKGFQLHSFVCAYPVVEKTILFPIVLSSSPKGNQLTINVRVYFWALILFC
jgi:hypothetical protein